MRSAFFMSAVFFSIPAFGDFNLINQSCTQIDSPYTAVIGQGGDADLRCLNLGGLNIDQRMSALQGLQGMGVFINGGVQAVLPQLNFLCAGFAQTGSGVVVNNGAVYNFSMNGCYQSYQNHIPSPADINIANQNCTQVSSPHTAVVGFGGDARMACGSLVGVSVEQRERIRQGLQLLAIPVNFGVEITDLSVNSLCVGGVSTGTGVELTNGYVLNLSSNVCMQGVVVGP